MATENAMKSPRFAPTFFATIAVASFAYATAVLILMHLLRPDYTLVDHMISDYAVGRYGWVMATCFLAMGLGCMMLMLGLARSGPTSVVGRLGAFLLVIPAIGLVISGIFPTDLEEATVSTRSGQIHDIAFLVNVVSIILATVLLSVAFRSQPRWRGYQRTAAALSLLVVLAFVLQFLTLHRGAPYGLTNRFFVIALFAWFLTTSIRLRALARE